MIKGAVSDRLPVAQVHNAYCAWCKPHGVMPELKDLVHYRKPFTDAKIASHLHGGSIFFLAVKLKG